jgi:hypothetical protein
MPKPTAEDLRWYEAAQRFKPEQSLDRIQTLANFVFTNVAVVATLLGGLGLVENGAAALRSAPRIGDYPLPLLLVGLSLLAASVAVWPKLSRVNPSRIDTVKRWYTGQVLRRGIAVIVALTALSAAIVVATLSFVAPALNEVRLSASVEEGKRVTLKVTVAVTGASPKAVATTTVDQKPKSGGSIRLFNSQSSADAAGAVEVEGSVVGVAHEGSFLVTSTVMDGTKVVARKTLEIPA